MDQLPTALEREPLVDAVFEVRFSGQPQLADILPGLLFGHLEPKPKIERQPAADIPKPLRANDQNLTFAPIIRLDLEHFTVSVGDRNVVIGCKLPYPKWPAFKSKILELTALMAKVGIDSGVERFSIKYTNIIEAASFAEQIAKIEMALRIGPLEVVDHHLNLRVQHNEDEILHIISVITGAGAKLSTGETREGVVVDVDSIRNIGPLPFPDFAAGLEPELETLRQKNKEMFFRCLKPETIKEMGPIYD